VLLAVVLGGGAAELLQQRDGLRTVALAQGSEPGGRSAQATTRKQTTGGDQAGAHKHTVQPRTAEANHAPLGSEQAGPPARLLLPHPHAESPVTHGRGEVR
jgi:hypothetical protein